MIQISKIKYNRAVISSKRRCEIVMVNNWTRGEWKGELMKRKNELEQYLQKNVSDNFGGINYLYYRVELDRINKCLYGYIDKDKFIKIINI